MIQDRAERPRDLGQPRQSPPRVTTPVAGAARIENGAGRDVRSGRADGQQRAWRGQGQVNGGTWQQQRQGVRSGTVDGRTAEQWRDRQQNRREVRPGIEVNRSGRNDQQWRDRNNDGRPDARPAWQGNRGGWQDGRRDSNSRNNGWQNDRGGSRSWDRGWRSNSRYDWSNYRARNRTVYRLGRYNSPYANYRYSRIGIGYSLNSLFYGQNYWLSDPWQYRLPEVYGPYRWVRYYDDVVLVDIYSGEVVDVIYDFFW